MTPATRSGHVFDIQRFSTHDGVGIRTTVFLKGCPLACVWCQNPEGLCPQPQPIWASGTCIHCDSCRAAAPDALEWHGDILTTTQPKSPALAKAMDVCPTRALRWDARHMDTQQVLAELRKDAIFYQHGGGVTFSGGEPLLQAAFVGELLQLCKQEGWHTAIETSLYAPWESIEPLLPHLDTIFTDMKLWDDEEHKRYTGVSNERILDNLSRLLRGPHRRKVVVRTPLVPGLTATEENIQNIAAFITGRDPDVQYELLNYNPLAAGKYPLVGKAYFFEENPAPYTPEQMARFTEVAKAGGVKKPVVE